MSDGVDTAGSTHRRRQCHCEVNIVYDCARQDLGVTPRRFLPIRSLTQDGSHLATSVRCWNTYMIQPGSNADRLAQSNGAPAAKADHAVRTTVLRVLQCLLSDVRWGMHRGIAKEASRSDGAIFQDRLQGFDLVCLLRCR